MSVSGGQSGSFSQGAVVDYFSLMTFSENEIDTDVFDCFSTFALDREARMLLHDLWGICFET